MVLEKRHLAEKEMDHSSERDNELKMFKINKNNDEGNSRSLVFKILRAGHSDSMEKLRASQSDGGQADAEVMLHSSDSLSPSGFLPADSKLLPFDSPKDLTLENLTSEIAPPSPRNIKPYVVRVKQEKNPDEDLIPENNASEIGPSSARSIEPYVLSVKPEESQTLRRSSRLQALQVKAKLLNDTIKEEEETDDSDSEGVRRKRRKRTWKKRSSTKEYDSGNAKCPKLQASGVPKVSISDKRDENSQTNSSERKSMSFSVKSETPGSSRDSKTLKLKNMLVTPVSKSTISTSSLPRKQHIVPKFANVDPSRVLATLEQHKGALPNKKHIALFLTRNELAIQPSLRQNGNSQYCFRKMQRDMRYLRKKYHLLDTTTMDYYYAMTGYSLRKTEIMLMDMISGKEIIRPKDVSASCYVLTSLNSPTGFYVQNFSPDVSPAHYKETQPYQCKNKQSLDRTQAKSDVLCHNVLVEALMVLYSDEAVTV